MAEAAARLSVPINGPRRIRILTGTWQAAGIAYRWARTFSFLGTIRAPLGLLGLALVWPGMLVLTGLVAGDIVQCERAAVVVPNRRVRPRRRHWGPILLAVAGYLLFGLMLSASLVLLPQPWSTTVAKLLTFSWLASATFGLIDVIPLGCQTIRYRQPMRQWTEQVRRESGREVVGGTWFGAWPRGGGSGTALLVYLRAEAGTDGSALVAMARSPRVAKVYVAHGAKASTSDPALVAWW